MTIGILIPAYQPDEKLTALVRQLKDACDFPILLVNDGSDPACDPIFAQAEQQGCTVLAHPVNRGKGRALKTGLEYAVQQDWDGVVTADADGQHTVEDILRIAAMLAEDTDRLVLGVRNLRQMPPRSRTGNTITRLLFRFLYGRWITDTQTGLRGIGRGAMGWAATLEGERYEYETNMLIWASQHNYPMAELTISTVYIDNNRSSHFHALRDGSRVYRLLLRQAGLFAGSSLVCFGVDYGLFAVLSSLLHQNLFVSVGLARLVSSFLNFKLKQHVLFQKRMRIRYLVQYYLLVICIFLANYALMFVLVHLLHIHPLLAKPLVEVALYLASYSIQSRGIFR